MAMRNSWLRTLLLIEDKGHALSIWCVSRAKARRMTSGPLQPKNLANAPEVLAADKASQVDKQLSVSQPNQQRAHRQFRRMGHTVTWHYALA
eukprot:3935818-Rhodomonas_salina.2